MSAAVSESSRHVFELLRSVNPDFGPQTTLRQLRAKAPDVTGFDWMLIILALEIDLCVEIPPQLADDPRLTVERFAARIAALPRVRDASFTLDRLTLLSEALFAADTEQPAPPMPSLGRSRRHVRPKIKQPKARTRAGQDGRHSQRRRPKP